MRDIEEPYAKALLSISNVDPVAVGVPIALIFVAIVALTTWVRA